MSVIPRSSFFSYNKPVRWSKDDLISAQTDRYRTHDRKDKSAIFCHKAAQIISLPFRMNIRALAYTFQPLPGKNKDKPWMGVAIRVAAVFAAVVLLPFSLLSLPLSAPFQFFFHGRRPMVSVIHNRRLKTPVPSGNTLSVRTHNLGFVYEFFRIAGDLRAVKTRAEEIGQWIHQDKDLPEFIYFQEAFHMSGTKKLTNELKEKYPYVIHSIAPHAMGLNNGGVIASQYPIEELSFRPFDDMMGPEKLSTRGLIKVRILKNGKKIDIYGTHLQALLGKERAATRKRQMERIIECITNDRTENGADQADAIVLMGDLNASQITAWGEESDEDKGVFDAIDANFVDLFRNDHDRMGKRTSGKPRFVEKDSPDGVTKLDEPSGSWFIGPFANKGALMRIKEWYERKFNKVGKKTQAVAVPKNHGWGTKKWADVQHACSARFDFILRYIKNPGDGQRDRAEIRRVKVAPETQSAPSDHAPVDGVIHF